MSIITDLTRSWLTRSWKPFTFKNEYDQVLPYSDCENLGLYIHIPFCKSICNFCPYCKVKYNEDVCSSYIDALIDEIHLVGSQHIGKKEILLGVIMGVPNYFSSSLVLRALSHMDAMIVFPTYSTGCIFVVAVAGIFFFKEKLTRRQFLSLGMIMSAIVMLNI